MIYLINVSEKMDTVLLLMLWGKEQILIIKHFTKIKVFKMMNVNIFKVLYKVFGKHFYTHCSVMTDISLSF